MVTTMHHARKAKTLRMRIPSTMIVGHYRECVCVLLQINVGGEVTFDVTVQKTGSSSQHGSTDGRNPSK